MQNDVSINHKDASRRNVPFLALDILRPFVFDERLFVRVNDINLFDFQKNMVVFQQGCVYSRIQYCKVKIDAEVE